MSSRFGDLSFEERAAQIVSMLRARKDDEPIIDDGEAAAFIAQALRTAAAGGALQGVCEAFDSQAHILDKTTKERDR